MTLASLPEKTLERYLVRRVRALGGQCFKFLSPGRAGMPDRMIVLPGNRISFLEIKAPGKKPRPLQLHVLALLTRLGCKAGWADSKGGIDAFLT
jgi:hypothetical protein